MRLDRGLHPTVTGTTRRRAPRVQITRCPFTGQFFIFIIRPAMNDDQLLRYSRHILLPQIGIEGQEAIVAARVLVVGAGGLGSPARCIWRPAGVGTLVLADGDTVDLTNLQRQILHSQGVGRLKVDSGRDTLAR